MESSCRVYVDLSLDGFYFVVNVKFCASWVRAGTMHDLLKHVLTERDLTRAGDIFAIPDSEIVDDLNEVVRIFIRNTRFMCTDYTINIITLH